MSERRDVQCTLIALALRPHPAMGGGTPWSHAMTEIERLTKIREILGEARRYVPIDVFVDMAREAIGAMDDSDSACADSLRAVIANAIATRQVDPDATRGAIDYVRCQLALAIGRLDRDARRQAKELYS